MTSRRRGSSAVFNLSTRASFDCETLFSHGAFRLVYTGRYIRGARKGEAAVAKWFKSGAVYEDVFFNLDIQAVDKAQAIIDAFNDANLIHQKIYLNRPEVWEFTTGPRRGQKALVEPFIHDFEKFNSNSGRVWGGTSWHKVMQALSHFSYHHTGGQFVLCDVQGGLLPEGGAILTDPVILSRNRSYGVTDLGPDGITTFFTRHQCNSFCEPHWTRPRERATYFPLQAGTSMVLHPSAASAQRVPAAPRWRPDLPAFNDLYDECDDYDDDDDAYYDGRY